MRGLDGKLSGLTEATPEALAAGELGLTEANARQADAAKAKDAADLEAQNARHCRTLTQDVERLRTERVALDKEGPSVERARAELERARRANAIVPRLEAFKTATSKKEGAREAHTIADGAAGAQRRRRAKPPNLLRRPLMQRGNALTRYPDG